MLAGDVGADEVKRLFAVHGESALQRLRGAFAVALWDEKSRSLLLARDALGRKPLYYCVSGKQIWFGTRSPKAAPRGQIDRAALSDYLELGYVPAPATTWSAVRKVPSGHLVRWQPYRIGHPEYQISCLGHPMCWAAAARRSTARPGRRGPRGRRRARPAARGRSRRALAGPGRGR